MHLSDCKAVFFDFDGVIKESVNVKSVAFYNLFLSFDDVVAARVKKHHEDNGGMSRYEKLPLYLQWAGQPADDLTVEKYASKFSQMVTQSVIDSPWVNGVLDYLQNHYCQKFFLVSATPQNEIVLILQSLKIDDRFEKVVGSPTTKDVAIRDIIDQFKLKSADCIMIGDAVNDYDAAKSNEIRFVLRKTPLNRLLQRKLQCDMILDFSHG